MSKRSRVYAFFVFVYRVFAEFGIDFLRMKRAFFGLIPFFRDASFFFKEGGCDRFAFSKGKAFPCLCDRYDQSGVAEGAYFHQDLYAAQKIYKRNPERHIDVGSRVGGFVAHVASFREIEVMDVRSLSTTTKNILFRQADMMVELDPQLTECCDSLSCLHALEHFGLGRYGDPVSRNGFLQGWDNLYRMLKPGGFLYFSVPLGLARIEFNAHRVFSVELLRQLIGEKYELMEFSYIDDDGAFHENVALDAGLSDDFGCWFGCAVLELRKK